MFYKLLLDTSDQYLSIGVAEENKLIYEKSFEAWQRQSELLVPEIVLALNSLKITLKDIKEIVIGKGPGSYTGVRIAMTFAKTLSTVTDIKIKAISSLAILGRADENFVSLINARSKRSYIAIYSQGNCLLKDQILPNEKVLEIIKEYHEKGFKIYGNTTYLNIPNDGQKIIEGLLTFANITKVEEDILSLKPIYLKDTL